MILDGQTEIIIERDGRKVGITLTCERDDLARTLFEQLERTARRAIEEDNPVKIVIKGELLVVERMDH